MYRVFFLTGPPDLQYQNEKTSCSQPGLVFPEIFKGWLAIAKLKPLSLFISLFSMPKKAFDNVKIEK